jgi:hypothetical protein
LKTHGVGGDVRKVCGDTGGVDNIVQCELIDERGELEQQGQGLTKASSIPNPSNSRVPGVRQYLSNTARGTSDNYS